MAERNFIVLRYKSKVPAMAGCEKCKRKFFTPATYSHDAIGAQEYLFSKFDDHSCEEPHRNQKSNLEKVLASLNTPCTKCGYSIPPRELRRVGWDEILCPKCGERLVPRQRAGGMSAKDLAS